MLSVVLQPYSYKRMKSLNDIKSVAILKFGRKGILEEDFTFESVYDCTMAEVENKKELFDLLIKNIQKDNLVTYNSRLLVTTLRILADNLNEDIPDEVIRKIPDLMVAFARLHNGGRWAKLEDALQYYDHTLSVDTEDPYDMTQKTIVLYRLMQEAGDL